MKVGIPREIKNHEYRVAITPAGVHELARGGHQVVIEAGAGEGSSIPDEDFVTAGAKILPTSCPTGRCRCSPRCPRSPAGWRLRSARTTCSVTAAGAAC